MNLRELLPKDRGLNCLKNTLILPALLYFFLKLVHLQPQSVIALGQAEIAQLVERDLAKVEVAGSSPVFRSKPYNARMVLCLINFSKN